MESNLKIDCDFISTWHPKYDQIANDENEYRNLVRLVKKEIGQKSTISKETFIRILNWKCPRVKGIVRLNEFNIYEKGITAANSAEEDQKLKLLVDLQGIGPPVGSTILHFMYPNSFPIIDKRTAETLHYAGCIESSLRAFPHYASFKSAILEIATENPSFTLREIDRALFAYHKIHLSPKLKQSVERKGINRRIEMRNPQGTLRIKDKVLSVFQDKVGEKFLREEIIDLVVYAYPGTNRSSIIPSDYCYNMINAGITFDFHIFELLMRGQYEWLGPNYPYSGPIYWKGEQVGKWEEGRCQLWEDPRK